MTAVVAPIAPSLTIIRRRVEPRATRVFDTYWRFAAERQAIFYRRLAGLPGPWTDDLVLADYKFTNAYRASDRTSQFLIGSVIYDGKLDPHDAVFRTLLFKLFNRIDAWTALLNRVGDITTGSFETKRFGSALADAVESGVKLYSAAYIIPPVTALGANPKYLGHLGLVQLMLDNGLIDEILCATSLHAIYTKLASYPSLGRFLAFQLTVDVNYGPGVNFDEGDFVVAGPGATEGIAKCFEDRGEWSDEDIIRWATDRQEREFEQRGIEFPDLWGRRLQPIDCQNLFCEVGKYARVAHPGASRPGQRARIKQRFGSDRPLPIPWYPPKWGLNASIAGGLQLKSPFSKVE